MDTTGVRPGTRLRSVDGDVHTSFPGQVVTGVAVRGTVYVDHSDVLVHDVEVIADGGSSWGISIGREGPVSGVVVRDCSVDAAGSDQGGVTGADGSAWTLS